MLWQDHTLISVFELPVFTGMAWIGYRSGHNHDLLSTAFVRIFNKSFLFL